MNKMIDRATTNASGKAWVVVVVGLFLIAVVALYAVTGRDSGVSVDRLALIDARMAQAIQQGEMIGGAGLIARNGTIVYQKNWGYADKAKGLPVTDDTLFRIYSMTKPITSVAVLRLYEEGKLSLHDPIAKYIPELADLKVALSTSRAAHTQAVVGDGTTIEKVDNQQRDLIGKHVAPARQPTIIDLLNHTSGFTYGLFGTSEVDELYRQAGIGDPMVDLAEYVKRLGKLPLMFEPGDRWHYSVSTDVLGRLVEVVSGKTFSVYLREMLFEPLGMHNTAFRIADEQWHRLAKLYSPAGTQENLVDAFDNVGEGNALVEAPASFDAGFRSSAKMESGGGGLISTLHDYFRFTQMLLNGGELDGVRILSPKTVQLMTANHLNNGETVWDTAGRGFGLGVAVSTDQVAFGEIGTVGEYNWGGAAGTSFWVDPTEKMIGIFFTQSMPHTTTLRRDFKVLAYQSLIESYVNLKPTCREQRLPLPVCL